MSAEPVSASVPCATTRIRANGVGLAVADLLAVEEPLEIRVQGKSIAVTMRTPGHDAELAVGFLLSEGLLHQRSDIVEISPCLSASDNNVLNVFLAPSVNLDLNHLSRHVFASSSCGICGKASIEDVHQHFPPLTLREQMEAQTLRALPARLKESQPLFQGTGAVHAAALFDLEGKLLLVREDVGRHNAVDKLIGHAWLNGPFPLERHVLLVSGRASFEITQKALAARIPVVAAISGPSSLAVDFARESGQTLVGFLRDESFNVYAHPERVACAGGGVADVPKDEVARRK